MGWRPNGIVRVYLHIVSMQLLCSPGHAAMIKSRTSEEDGSRHSSCNSSEPPESGLSLHASEGSGWKRSSNLKGSWPQLEETGPCLSVPQLHWAALSACLILSTGRQDPAHTRTSCLSWQPSLLSVLFKDKRWGGLKACLSQASFLGKLGRAWAALTPDSHPVSLSLSPGTQNIGDPSTGSDLLTRVTSSNEAVGH